MSNTIDRTGFEAGSPVSAVFLLKEKRLAVSKAGKKYLTLTLGDKHGDIDGKLWDEAEQVDANLERMAPVRVEGVISLYREKAQITVRTIQPLEWDDSLADDLLPVSEFSRDQLQQRVDQVLATLSNPHLKQLAQAFRSDDQLMKQFFGVPAAKSIHHAYVRGLAEHSLSMMEMAASLAQHYETQFPGQFDRDLVIMGAFIHDMGKTVEYEFERGIDITTEGRMVGHMLLGVEILTRVAAGIPDFPNEVLRRLKHLIASHHGEFEKGSPVLPVMLEAQLLHLIDYMDSQVNAVGLLLREAATDDWTAYSNKFHRRFLKASKLPAEAPAEVPDRPIPAVPDTSESMDELGEAPPPPHPRPDYGPTEGIQREHTEVIEASEELAVEEEEELERITTEFNDRHDKPGPAKEETSEYEPDSVDDPDAATKRKAPPKGPTLF